MKPYGEFLFVGQCTAGFMWIVPEVTKSNCIVREVNGRSDEESDGEQAEGREDVLVHDADPEFP